MPENDQKTSTENWNTALRYIAGRKAAEESLGFLAHISATVQQTPQLKEVLPAVAKACVPFLASAVSLGSLASHSQLVVQSPTGYSRALEGIRDLLSEGGTQKIVISTHEKLAKQTDPGHLTRLRQWQADSAAALPITYRGLYGGHLIALRGESHRRGPIGPADLALLSEVADRVAAFNAFVTQAAGSDILR
jgi:hypothetical protein